MVVKNYFNVQEIFRRANVNLRSAAVVAIDVTVGSPKDRAAQDRLFAVFFEPFVLYETVNLSQGEDHSCLELTDI